MDEEVLYQQDGRTYYPGTIKAVNYDGTFAVDYLYTKNEGKGEKNKHEARMYRRDLLV